MDKDKVTEGSNKLSFVYIFVENQSQRLESGKFYSFVKFKFSYNNKFLMAM